MVVIDCLKKKLCLVVGQELIRRAGEAIYVNAEEVTLGGGNDILLIDPSREVLEALLYKLSWKLFSLR